MRTKPLPYLVRPVILCSVLVAAALAACGSDDDNAPNATAGASAGGKGGKGGAAGASGSGAASGRGGAHAVASAGEGSLAGEPNVAEAGSAGEAGGGSTDAVARGRYLVQHVAACVDCHTPRNAMGALDATKLLSGSEHFADLNPADDTQGLVPTPNLTPDVETGLGAWSDEQIKNAFLNGIDKDEKPLFSIMPYYVFHNMSNADADAIVAYLRSIPAVKHSLPERQELGFPVLQAEPVPPQAVPQTTLATSDPSYASAEHGRYLAGFVGACLDCHSEHDPMGAVPLKIDRLFWGKESFSRAQLGLPPVFPENIVSSNLTPAVNGLKGWSAKDVVNTLRKGVDEKGQPLCPPMPFGPNGAFAGLSDEDALDIGIYITSLAPHDNGVIAECIAPGAPGGEAGSSGANGAP